MNINSIPLFLKKKFGWKLVKYPRFLNKYRWRPRFVFLDSKNKNYIAVDFIFNQRLSERIYKEEVFLALKENKKLKVCLFTPSIYEYGLLKKFCRKASIGLKIYNTNEINTIVSLPFEKLGRIIVKKAKKEGWFPKVVLNEVKKVKRISFKDLLKDLAKKLEENKSKDKQFSLIKRYLDKMLQSCHDFEGDSIPFMNLASFESLLQLSNIENRDHVFHSFRVFIIGCVIIDKFYDKFVGYFKEIFPGTKKINIEYIWLLTSIFHDIGKVKQKRHLICLHDPKEENVALTEAIEEEMSKVWGDTEYQLALGNIVELINHCCMKKENRSAFTGFAVHGAIDSKISGILIESYNKLKNHSVISCFDLAADLLRKISVSKLKKDKTFLLYHIFLVVVSIALHDWRIWNDLKDRGIFPLKVENFPLAALLIYIDTWDDFRREGEKDKISIDSILFKRSQCIINITWYEKNEYLEEKAKYESFKKNVRSKALKLVIRISNEKK